MQFYVLCKEAGHNAEKIYVKFDNQPKLRSEIPLSAFQLTCKSGHTNIYFRNDVFAEIGLEPIGGAILGALLFILDPLVGIAGAATGLFGIAARENEKVKTFNSSSG